MDTTKLCRLSHPQQGIWLDEMLNPGTSMWNLTYVVKLRFAVGLDVVEEAVHRVEAATEALRLRVDEEGEHVWQWVADPSRDPLERVDFSTPEGRAGCDAWLRQRADAPIPVTAGSLHSIVLATFEDGAPGFVLKTHHIAMDGTSAALVIGRIVEGCERLVAGELSWQPCSDASCIACIADEDAYLASEQVALDRAYWATVIEPLPEPVPLRPSRRSTRVEASHARHVASPDLGRAIYDFCREHHASPYRVMLAAVGAYLFRFASGEDVLVGGAYGNRQERETGVAMMANVVPVRMRFDETTTFAGLVRGVGDQVRDGKDHQRYTYDLMLADARGQDPSVGSLFQVAVTEHLSHLFPARAAVTFLGPGASPYDLTLYVGSDHRTAAPIELLADYRTDLFDEREVESFLGRLLLIVRAGIREPEAPIARLDLLSATERERLLGMFNASVLDYPRERTYIELFEDQAVESAHRIALEFDGRALTYAEVNAQANRLGKRLRSLGMGPEQRVCIMVDRSLAMVPGLLGIAKSGAAFVPVDPDYPRDRIAFILEDSGTSVLLTRRHLRDRTTFAGTVIDLDEVLVAGDDVNPEPLAQPDSLAYVIYTSGSTGRPKGVMIEQRSLVAHCAWVREFVSLTANDHCSKVAAFGFDASVMEIFPPLLVGATLHVVPDEVRMSPTQLAEYYASRGVTVAFLPTQFCEQFLELPEPPALRFLYTGGEALHHFKPRRYALANEYGPTEYTIVTTAALLEARATTIPIGKPLPNTQIVVLDRFANPQPVGAPGELCISGDQIARGYLNRPELTAERFIDNPVFPGRRMYRTGDLACWRDDGQLEYLGRIDTQVKIRGYRIELGEIESVLLTHPGVQDAVVADKTDAAGSKYLCGYYVADSDLDAGSLRTTLAGKLPDYMIPPYLMRVDRIPLSPNGKVDRKALPEVTVTLRRREDVVAPRTPVESSLVDLFKEILAVDEVSIEDSFFALGGQSLRAAMLQTRVERDLGVLLPLREIFATPTVAALAGLVERQRVARATVQEQPEEPEVPVAVEAEATEAEPVPGGVYPLSHSQRRELITELMFPGTPRANLPFVVRVFEEVDLALLERAIHIVTARFDALRLRIVQVGDEHRQVVAEPSTAPLEVAYLGEDHDGSALRAFMEPHIHRPFELLDTDLTRFVLLRFGPREGGFLMMLHHIAADGWTVKLVVNAILHAYRTLKAGGQPETAEAPPYREAVLAEQAYLASAKCQEDKDWWLGKLGDIPEEVVLPFGHGAEAGVAADVHHHRLAPELSAHLLEHCQTARTTPYSLFLGALASWIARVTGSSDVVIGALSHGRATERERATAGMLVNAFPLRLEVGPQQEIGALTRAAESELRYLLKNRVRYPFDLLVSELRALNDNRVPGLLNVVLVGQDFGGDEKVSIEYIHAGAEQPPFQLIINVIHRRAPSEAVELLVASPRGMFTQAEIAAVCADLECLAGQVVGSPERAVAELAVPSIASGTIVVERATYPLVSAQKRIFLVEQLKGVGTTYNIPLRLDLDGDVDEARLLGAIETLVERHETLRTSFELSGSEPVQRIHPRVRYRPTVRDVGEEEVDAAIGAFVRPFDLTSAPLFRVELLRISNVRRVLLLDFHHSVFDGTSLVVFLQELVALYGGATLPAVATQYREFALAQQRLLRSARLRRQEQFWLAELAGGVPVLNLPTDHPRPAVMDYAGDRYTLALSRELTCRLNDLAGHTGTTPFMVLLAVLNTLLARYTGQDDIVVGVGAAGRGAAELQRTIGMFINTLPVRSFPALDKTFLAFLQETRDHLLSVLDNQDYPFERLVERLNVTRDASRNPVFDVGFVYQNIGLPERLTAGGVSFTRRAAVAPSARLDLMLDAAEAEGRLGLTFEYRTSLFARETIVRLAGHLRMLLEAVTAGPESRLADLQMLTPAEDRTLVWELNRTEVGFPAEATVHTLFEQVVERFPDRVAVTYQGRDVTYRELDERANQLARTLRARGVQPDTIVALMLDKCPEMIVGIIAIMKAGGCYLPIKPDFPADRIQFMLENSGTRLLVTTAAHRAAAGDFAGGVVDIFAPASYDADSSTLEHVNQPHDLIYIIYTSGSTGKPKGVMLEHRNVVRLFVNDRIGHSSYYAFDEHDVWSMFHSFCFDFSVWEMYGALLYGGRMVIVPKEVTVNPAELVALCKREKVTVLSQTPGAFYNFIAEDLATDDHDLVIRYVTFGGEALKPALLADWHARYPETKLINMYGITETTVHVTYKEITEAEITSGVSNIGVPIPNLSTYIMDRHLRLLPIGVPGEICVGGEGVARGYLGRPELTAEKFVPSPCRAGERLYRSGDLARMLPSGEMEYLGRIDFQVKIRGFRIELGEIETCLERHEEVDKAVVLARDDKDGAKYIVAYLVARRDLSVNELREHLLKALPDYMVPAYFVQLEALPLTPNGKVDRKALPEPGVEVVTGEQIVAPRNAAEEKIARAWCKVLGLQHVSVLDNFFALGGHSLRAVSVVAELQKDFEISVNDVFSYQTVARLAEHVRVREDNLRLRIAELKELIPAQRATFDPTVFAAKQEAYRERNQRYEGLDLTHQKSYRSVLLTGATGYLGAHLLRELLDRDVEVWTIVRGETEHDATARLVETMRGYFGDELLAKGASRLHVLSGDLGSPRLGLTEAWWKALAFGLDCIINPAALVKHYGHYDEFHHANVQSVANLVELASTGRPKDLHHVSTLSVADGRAPGVPHLYFSEDDADLGQRSENYYVRTKVEAEKLVVEARARGLDARIYRVGNISINSSTGALQKNIEENAFYTQVRAFANLGVVPSTEDETELAYVDQLARAILMLHDREALAGETFHLLNSNIVKLSEALTAPALDLNVRAVPLDELVDLLNTRYDAKGFKPHVEALMLHRGWMGLLAAGQSASKASTPVTYLSERTNGLLARLGFEWPQADPMLLKPMVRQALQGRVAVLQGSPVLEGCSEDEVLSVARRAAMTAVPAGQAVVWEGEPAEQLHIVADGHLEVFRRSPSGWFGTLAVLGSGEFVGEESALGIRESAVTAEALLDEVLLLSLPGAEVARLLAASPALARGLLGALTERLRRMERLVVSVG